MGCCTRVLYPIHLLAWVCERYNPEEFRDYVSPQEYEEIMRVVRESGEANTGWVREELIAARRA
jgi:hypothetical protein